MNAFKPSYTRPLDLKSGRIEMSHGAGGRAMAQLVSELFDAAYNKIGTMLCYPMTS